MMSKRKIDDALPAPVSEAQIKLAQDNAEHLKYLDDRLKLLRAPRTGHGAPKLHIRLFGQVNMPRVSRDVLGEMGLDKSVATTYDMDYFGFKTEAEFEHARMKGLLGFPGLWFTVGKEQK